MNKSFLFILLLVLLASNVTALGITPGRSTFDFEPGIKKTVDFKVINSESRDMNLIVLVQGELNESIALSEVSFKMLASEKEKNLQYTLTMPSNLKPGLREAEVVVVQLPDKSGTSDAFIGAAVGVATQAHVYVPYPGKYIEADINVNDGDKVNFIIPVHNRGDLDLARVRATIDIYSSLNEKIATIDTSQVSLLSGERKDISASWDKSANPGAYRAVVSVLYDEQVLNLEREFNIGNKVLEIQQIVVNDFILGGIAKFELLVDNKWSEKVTAYAQMLIYNSNGEVMADFKSATYDIEPLQKALLTTFWDTEGVRKGTYDSSVILRYGENSVQQDLKLEVSDRNINVIGVGYVISSEDPGFLGGNTLVIVLVIGIVLMILINLTWFLVLRKRLKK